MKTAAKKLYEAMFLVDSAQAGSDWDGILATIKSILQKAEAEIVSLKKWADRKLAYKINHKTKGTYILCYFRADGKRIAEIERDVQLSERIMRVLILNAEKWAPEGVKEAASVTSAQEREAKAAQQTEPEQEDAKDIDNPK